MNFRHSSPTCSTAITTMTFAILTFQIPMGKPDVKEVCES